MKDNHPILVSIRCITYNQEPYIRQCLEGFVQQKTTFRFEAVVHDDASTDGTADVIREYAEKYPDIIKPILETENQYSKHDGSLSRIINEHIYGKYIANCEGDDYWTDPLKLQKQVDFLEAHPDYGMVHCRARAYEQSKGCFQDLSWGADFKDADQLIVGNTITTLTTCYRTDLYRAYQKEINIPPTWKMGDYPLWLYIALKSKVHFLNDVVGVYRIQDNSASHSTDIHKEIAFRKSVCEISSFFARYAHKEYLLPAIKKRTLMWVYYVYRKNNMRVGSGFWNLLKEYKIIPWRILPGVLLTQFKLGRYLLKIKDYLSKYSYISIFRFSKFIKT